MGSACAGKSKELDLQKQLDRMVELQDDVLNHMSKYERVKLKDDCILASEKVEAFISAVSATVDAAKVIQKKTKSYLEGI